MEYKYREEGNVAIIFLEDEVETVFGLKRIVRKDVLRLKDLRCRYIVSPSFECKVKAVRDYLNEEVSTKALEDMKGVDLMSESGECGE